VGSGSFHTCGITPAGAAYCWGQNDFSALGDGTTTQRTSPVPVAGGLSFAAATGGGFHTCGVTTGGAAYCWGSNRDGELGDGSAAFTQTTPVAVVGGLSFAVVSPGAFHTCGVTAGGSAYCWGSNLNLQLGNGTNIGSNTPIKVAGQL
jgi:alpha-tubulin suppressor-like RCC1 family protein